jgi:hypothetical protein
MRRLPYSLVLFSDRELDIDRGEQGEDVSLENCDQDFEESECEAECQRSDTEQREPATRGEEEELGRGKEQHQQEVTDDHVHQESQRQGDRANDERRDQLDRGDDDVHRPRHTGREQRVLEELARALFDTGVNEGDVRDDGEHKGHTNNGRSGNVESRNNTGDIHRQDHKEQGGEDREEPLGVFLAEQVFTDVHPNEVERHLGEALASTGNDTHLPGAEPEQNHYGRDSDEADEDDSVDLERRPREENDLWEEFFDGWSVEVTVGC